MRWWSRVCGRGSNTCPVWWRRSSACAPSDPRVLRCVASIQAQSIAYLPNPIAARLGLTFTPTPAHLDEMAAHIAEFSLAGIHAVGRAVHAR